MLGDRGARSPGRRRSAAAKTLLSKLEEAVVAIKNAMKGATWGRLNTRDLEQSYKAFDLWMTGLSNAIEKAENAPLQSVETAESDVKTERYSLVTLKDGTVYVQADRQVFTSSNMDKRAIALEHALMEGCFFFAY